MWYSRLCAKLELQILKLGRFSVGWSEVVISAISGYTSSKVDLWSASHFLLLHFQLPHFHFQRPLWMTLNGVIDLFCVILPIVILYADYVTVVEDRPTVWVEKVAPLKLFAIFSLLVNLCNWKLPWLLSKHIPLSTLILVHLFEYLCKMCHFYRCDPSNFKNLISSVTKFMNFS